MARIDPRQIYDYLLQKGVSPASAAGILANIQYESSFNPAAVGDNGTSGGLFQHHKGRWANLKKYAASTGRRWDDWTAQVDFALKEARQMGVSLTHTNAVAASKEWTLKFERPANAAYKARQRASAVGTYMYGGGGGGPVASPGSGNAAPSSTQEAMNVPDGGTWYAHPKGGYVIVYPVGGARVFYRQTAAPSGAKVYPAGMFARNSVGYIDGGTTDSFRGVPQGKTYQALVDDHLMQLGLAGTDALQDSGVMAIVALSMTRELSPAELANRLRQTKWYQARTDKEREWNDLSDAEKEQRLVDEAMKLSGLWFTYVGEDLQVGQYDKNNDGVVSAAELQAGNKELYTWAERLASGGATQAQAVNAWMKDKATENPESPWSRTVREEEISQGQHAVDIANMAGQVRDLYRSYGIPISDQKLQRLATDVVMNNMAYEDVEKNLDDQARAMYKTKPAGMSTREWAEPYIQTYMQTLETGEPELKDQMVQRALRQGMNLAEFEKMLRADARWLETKGARNEMNQKISDLGRVMGF